MEYFSHLPGVFSKNIKKNIIYDLIHNNNVSEINSDSIFQWYNLENLTKDIDTFSTKFKIGRAHV